MPGPLSSSKVSQTRRYLIPDLGTFLIYKTFWRLRRDQRTVRVFGGGWTNKIINVRFWSVAILLTYKIYENILFPLIFNLQTSNLYTFCLLAYSLIPIFFFKDILKLLKIFRTIKKGVLKFIIYSLIFFIRFSLHIAHLLAPKT